MKVVYVPPRNKWPTPSAWDLLLGLVSHFWIRAASTKLTHDLLLCAG